MKRMGRWVLSMMVAMMVLGMGVTAVAEGGPSVTNPTDLLEMADQIGLSSEQRSTLRRLQQREERELEPTRQRITSISKEIQVVANSEQPDRERLQSLMREVQQLGQVLQREERRFRRLVEATVSASQIRAAEDYMEQHLDAHEEVEEVDQ